MPCLPPAAYLTSAPHPLPSAGRYLCSCVAPSPQETIKCSWGTGLYLNLAIVPTVLNLLFSSKKKKHKGCRIEPHFCSSAQNEVLVARGVMQPPATQPAQVGLKEFLSMGALAGSWPPAASASSWGFSARPSRPCCPSSPIVISASS